MLIHIILVTDPERAFSAFIPCAMMGTCYCECLGPGICLQDAGPHLWGCALHPSVDFGQNQHLGLNIISTSAFLPPLRVSPPWPQSTCSLVLNSSVYSQGHQLSGLCLVDCLFRGLTFWKMFGSLDTSISSAGFLCRHSFIEDLLILSQHWSDRKTCSHLWLYLWFWNMIYSAVDNCLPVYALSIDVPSVHGMLCAIKKELTAFSKEQN